jgi:hypothetical protein
MPVFKQVANIAKHWLPATFYVLKLKSQKDETLLTFSERMAKIEKTF